MPVKRQYQLASALPTQDAFVERLLASGKTIVSDDPIHYPPEYDFLLNLDDPNRIRIRHYGSSAWYGSPILQLDVTPMPWGLALACSFVASNSPFSAQEQAAQRQLEALDIDESALVWLWNALVWNLWLHAFVERRALKTFGPRLLAKVKEVAEADGIPAAAVSESVVE